ncbi:MAG: L,D-transpeptidase family protein [Kiritimatiellae bacterium]|nr:L,D-transpeptidase family protein [Kiritimatiellia bacterium]
MQKTQLWDAALNLGFSENGYLLVVDIISQKLFCLYDQESIKEYIVSTSKYGLGNVQDSFKTPTGIHEVVQWIGKDEPIHRIFHERQPTPDIWDMNMTTGKDLILTRILRLAGLEEGINKGPNIDSYKRMIYLHGTQQEDLLGTPASHGCIRLKNKDIIELCDLTWNTPTWCWIGAKNLFG